MHLPHGAYTLPPDLIILTSESVFCLVCNLSLMQRCCTRTGASPLHCYNIKCKALNAIDTFGTVHYRLNMATNNNSNLNWLECISAIEVGDELIYFCNQDFFHQNCHKNYVVQDADTLDKKNIPTEFHIDESESSIRQGRIILKLTENEFQSFFQREVFLYSLTAYNPMNVQRSFVENEIQNQLLLADLRDSFTGCEIFNNFSYFIQRCHHFERGFTVVVPLHSTNQHERIIYNLSIKYGQEAYFKCRIEGDGSVSQKLVFLENNGLHEEVNLVVVKHMSFHPAFLYRENNSVFHNFEEVANVLSQVYRFLKFYNKRLLVF